MARPKKENPEEFSGKFNDLWIKALKPRPIKYQYRESKGFALKVHPSGVKTFVFIYQAMGKRKELVLGQYPATGLAEARIKYQEAAALWGRGTDPKLAIQASSNITPTAVLQTEIITVKALVEKYIEWGISNYAARSYEDKQCTLNFHIVPKLGNLPINELKRPVIIAFMEELKQSKIGQGAVRNVYKALNAMINFAVGNGFIEYSPMTQLRKLLPYVADKIRSRVLSEKEIKAIWEQIDITPACEVTKKALKMILVTAQRPGEVLGMHSREVEGDWWTIPPERAEKGKRYHRVFLTDTAKSLMPFSDGYIFRSPHTSQERPICISAIRVISRRLSKDSRWTPHDLRRTARTQMAKIGISDEHGEAVVNHAKRGMVQVYNQYGYDTEKKEALLQWEAELLRIIKQL